jgi:hypothetical protein
MVTPLSTGRTWPVTIAGFVTGEIKRRAGDVVGLDQPEQMRVGQPCQRSVSRN